MANALASHVGGHGKNAPTARRLLGSLACTLIRGEYERAAAARDARAEMYRGRDSGGVGVARQRGLWAQGVVEAGAGRPRGEEHEAASTLGNDSVDAPDAARTELQQSHPEAALGQKESIDDERLHEHKEHADATAPLIDVKSALAASRAAIGVAVRAQLRSEFAPPPPPGWARRQGGHGSGGRALHGWCGPAGGAERCAEAEDSSEGGGGDDDSDEEDNLHHMIDGWEGAGTHVDSDDEGDGEEESGTHLPDGGLMVGADVKVESGYDLHSAGTSEAKHTPWMPPSAAPSHNSNAIGAAFLH